MRQISHASQKEKKLFLTIESDSQEKIETIGLLANRLVWRMRASGKRCRCDMAATTVVLDAGIRRALQ